MSNILQSSLLTNFLYPFLLMFFIVFALLEKSKLFGSNQKQINAFVSLIVSLIFVSAVFPVLVVNHLILFMVVGIILIFVGFVLWGFLNGGDISLDDKVKKGMAVLVLISVIVALFWITGLFPSFWVFFQNLFNWAFNSPASGGFWSNFIIVVLVVSAVVAVLKVKGKDGAGK